MCHIRPFRKSGSLSVLGRGYSKYTQKRTRDNLSLVLGQFIQYLLHFRWASHFNFLHTDNVWDAKRNETNDDIMKVHVQSHVILRGLIMSPGPLFLVYKSPQLLRYYEIKTHCTLFHICLVTLARDLTPPPLPTKTSRDSLSSFHGIVWPLMTLLCVCIHIYREGWTDVRVI